MLPPSSASTTPRGASRPRSTPNAWSGSGRPAPAPSSGRSSATSRAPTDRSTRRPGPDRGPAGRFARRRLPSPVMVVLAVIGAITVVTHLPVLVAVWCWCCSCSADVGGGTSEAVPDRAGSSTTGVDHGDIPATPGLRNGPNLLGPGRGGRRTISGRRAHAPFPFCKEIVVMTARNRSRPFLVGAAIVALLAPLAAVLSLSSPASAAVGPRPHEVYMYKVEKHVDLSGEYPDNYLHDHLNCNDPGDIALDGMWRVTTSTTPTRSSVCRVTSAASWSRRRTPTSATPASGTSRWRTTRTATRS